jgi:RNA polymerase sigma-70 factor (ECF subfamily)
MNSVNKKDQFLAVIENNKGIIFKIVHSYSKNFEDRKDITQEIIIQLWKSFEKYDEKFKHTTWIYRIALNVAISFYRKERSREKLSLPFSEGIFQFPEELTSTNQDSNLNILQQFIQELKDLEKALILLYLEEKSHKEISQIMGITETNVATKIGRIKNILKQKFEQIKN